MSEKLADHMEEDGEERVEEDAAVNDVVENLSLKHIYDSLQMILKNQKEMCKKHTRDHKEVSYRVSSSLEKCSMEQKSFALGIPQMVSGFENKVEDYKDTAHDYFDTSANLLIKEVQNTQTGIEVTQSKIEVTLSNIEASQAQLSKDVKQINEGNIIKRIANFEVNVMKTVREVMETISDMQTKHRKDIREYEMSVMKKLGEINDSIVKLKSSLMNEIENFVQTQSNLQAAKIKEIVIERFGQFEAAFVPKQDELERLLRQFLEEPEDAA